MIPVMGRSLSTMGAEPSRKYCATIRRGSLLRLVFRDFKQDLGWDPGGFYPAQFLETLGVNWLRWPGNQIEDPNGTFKYLEVDVRFFTCHGTAKEAILAVVAVEKNISQIQRRTSSTQN